MKTTDGLGNEIDDDGEYYVQDARSVVGNCGSWWKPNGAGYCCDIREAGKYLGKDVRHMRDTDVPWPIDHVMQHAVVHIRVDNQAFSRNDDIYLARQKSAEELRARKGRRRG